MKSRIDLTEGPIGRHLVNLTIPMFLGISSMIVASMIDTVYVGWIGTLELAAVSFTFPVVMAMATVSMGLGIGAASIIARVVGAGDEEKVRRLCTDALFLVAVLVVALSALGLLVAEPLFELLGARDDILPLSTAYMSVWFLGLPAFALPMVATNIMRAVGNARLPGIIMASGAGLQVLMAPVLIFGLGSWEGLGITGAAWSFVLSRLAMFGYTYRVLRKMQLLSFKIERWAVHWASWKEILRIGVPSMMGNLIGPVSMGIVVALLAGYGHEVVAGFGVASRIETLAIMVIMALSASTGPFIGQNWGAHQYARIYRAQSLGYRFSYLWSLLAFVVLAGAGRYLVGFINDDPAVIDATYAYLVLMPATYGFLGVGMVAGSTFIALGKPMPTLVLSLVRMVVLFIPLALVMNEWFGYKGVFGAAAICNVVLGGLSFGWVRSMLRKEIARHGPQAGAA
ncbi:MAG: MATE family efflux transporter [Gammaproteobacteria bacterium]|nr:MATE family efflux transporter [Gammaproteobacteria bacterium]